MKKLISIMTILAITCVCAIGLTGCNKKSVSKHPDKPLSTSIVLTRRSGSK